MKILFQGDSITDALRERTNGRHMGIGYPTLVSAALGYERDAEYEFINRGISGNRIVDLYARVKCDIINLAPDLISILIGVNDTWHEFDFANGVSAERFYDLYCMLIEDVMAALPKVKLMILEPFVLDAAATEGRYKEFRGEVELRAAAARRVAEKYGLTFVPLQEGFDRLAQEKPATFWLSDGVHPTDAGHEFIKRKWIEAFDTING